ncbi:MAG TPA: PDZ domain-containing protein [Phycisphaerae bacterium]|nr:PDZ domain-containing protein [Phycisphaerae bacterium]
MRKAFSVTALVSSLVAGSALGVPAYAAKGREEGQAMVHQVRQDEQLAEGMRGLHRQMLAQVEALLSHALSESPAHDAVAGPGGEMLVAGPATTPAAPPAADQPMEKVTFLGVATDRVSAVLAEQLKLARGIGLVVLYVEKGSPADQAGLKLHDIVEKFDDQWVVNQEQFTVLVRMKKPGDQVTLTVVRAGQRVPVKVTLSEKQVPVTGEMAPAMGEENPLGGFMPQGLGKEGSPAPGWSFQRSSVHVMPGGVVEKKLVDDSVDIDLKQASDGSKTLVVKDHAGRELFNGPYNTQAQRAQVPVVAAAKVASLDEGVALQEAAGGGAGRIAVGQGAARTAVMTRTDDRHVIMLQVDGDKTRATVRDGKTGAVIFDGPVDTQKEINAMPDDVAEKVNAMKEKLAGQ